jgi:hypothetical protein
MSINLSIHQLRTAVDLKEKIEALETQLATILGGGIPSPIKAVKTGRRKGMSEAGKARIAAAQKLRWSKLKAGKPVKAKRKMSAAAKAKISAAAKLRWAKAKAAGKSRL